MRGHGVLGGRWRGREIEGGTEKGGDMGVIMIT